MNGIQRNPRWLVSGQLLNRQFPARSRGPTVVDAPNAKRQAGGVRGFAARDDPSFRRIHLECAATSGRRSLDRASWFGVPTGGTIENLQATAAADDQEIVVWIDND